MSKLKMLRAVTARFKKHFFSLRSWRRFISHVASYPSRVRVIRKLNYLESQRSVLKPYNSRPNIAGIVQFFNKRANIEMLDSGLNTAGFDEVIVLEDGSVDGSLHDWETRLTGKNHFIIRSNDLFEIITYDRAIRFSNADIVCLLQDDDRMPSNRRWIDRALDLFDRFPDLLILGGFRGLDILPCNSNIGSEKLEFKVENGVEEISGLFRHTTIQFDDMLSSSEGDFLFVPAVVRAPVFIRRKEFLSIGGFDLSFAPFLCDDIDNCLRAWLAGYKVGLYNVDFSRDVGLGGMRAFNSKRIEGQVRKNWPAIYSKFGSQIDDGYFSKMASLANRALEI